MQMVMQAKPKFAIIAKNGGSGLFGCLDRPIKRRERAGHLVTSYSPSHSEALSHPSLGSLPPLHQPEPLPTVADPCTSTMPCLTEPHHPCSHQPRAHHDRALGHCRRRSSRTFTALSSLNHLYTALLLHCLCIHCQFSSPVPLAQLALPCPSSSSTTEPCLAITEPV